MDDFLNKLPNKKTIRLQSWDYRSNGYYFVTMCTGNRINYFGQIKNKKMFLSKIGLIVKDKWLKVEQKQNNVILDEWIIMPDHFHGIIILSSHRAVGALPVGALPVGALHATPVREQQNKFSMISPKSGSLSTIIRSFKSAVSKCVHENGLKFEWHPRFYERIIRDDIELFRVRNYIRNNIINY